MSLIFLLQFIHRRSVRLTKTWPEPRREMHRLLENSTLEKMYMQPGALRQVLHHRREPALL